MQVTSGNSIRTGTRRARTSARRRVRSRRSADTRSRAGPIGAPWRTDAARAATRGRPSRLGHQHHLAGSTIHPAHPPEAQVAGPGHQHGSVRPVPKGIDQRLRRSDRGHRRGEVAGVDHHRPHRAPRQVVDQEVHPVRVGAGPCGRAARHHAQPVGHPHGQAVQRLGPGPVGRRTPVGHPRSGAVDAQDGRQVASQVHDQHRSVVRRHEGRTRRHDGGPRSPLHRPEHLHEHSPSIHGLQKGEAGIGRGIGQEPSGATGATYRGPATIGP